MHEPSQTVSWLSKIVESFIKIGRAMAIAAMDWSFLSQSTDTSRLERAEGCASDYKDLYERARDATTEAQRQGDAQLKAAIAAATAVKYNPIQLCPLSLKFNNTRVERAYWRKSNTNSDNRDLIPFAFQFLVHITLISLLFQGCQGRKAVKAKDEIAFLQFPTFLTRLVSYLWVATTCAAVLVIHLWFPSWYRGNRGTILLIVASSLWIGEGISLLASCPNSTNDLALILTHCIFMSVLHRVPFCLHLKTRAIGFGLQIFGTLASVRVDKALPALLFVSIGHSLGIALAYVLDQQSRVCFLQSLPQFILDEVSKGGLSSQFLSCRASLSQEMWNLLYPELFEWSIGDINALHRDSQVCHQKTPRRALGGFAGGFGGVSSLKGTYAPSFLAKPSSSPNLYGEECISEFSCSSSATVENSADDHLCEQYFYHQWSSHEDQRQSQNRVCTGSVRQCSVYRRGPVEATECMGL